MCIICAEYKNKQLTVLEAFSNLAEMEDSIEESHYNDVLEMLNKELERDSFQSNKEINENFNPNIDYDEAFETPWDDSNEPYFDDDI